MSSYRRTQLVFSSIRRKPNPRILPKSPVSDVSSRIHRNGPSIPAAKSSGCSSISSISISSRELGLGFGWSLGKRKTNAYDPFLSGAKRFYCGHRYQVHHFMPRGERWWRMIVVLLGTGVLITLCFWKIETVPYTERRHYVFLSISKEKQVGEVTLQRLKAEYKAKILPAMHPESVRVRSIAKDIIDALQRRSSTKHLWSDLGCTSVESDSAGEDMIMALRESKGAGTMGGVKRSKEDEILYHKWIQQSRENGQEKGSQPTASLREGFDWEVLLVNDPDFQAFSKPAGKIVLFTGYLEHFNTDFEIATIIGHEVGHAVARHLAEQAWLNSWFELLPTFLSRFILPDPLEVMIRREMEADYIGMLLVASAGYDPREVPKVYEKLGKLTDDLADRACPSTHLPGKKRAELLAQAKVMEEALAIYREVQSGRRVEGFR